MNDRALVVQPSGAIAGLGEMSVQSVVDRKRKIVEVMEAVMKDGEHFGKIPGCGPKPTLFKAGAEVLAMTFGFAPTFKIERSDLPNGHREYQVVCTLTHIATGAVVGEGLGCATTMESKHRWRSGSRLCPECGKAAIIKGKAEYGGGWLCFPKKDGCGSKWKDGDAAIEGQSTDRVENPDPADVYNTILKMAKKRAQVDCTLTACGASDLLAQDLEDLPPGSVVEVERHSLVDRFESCPDHRTFVALEAEMRSDWERIAKAARPAVGDAFMRARDRIKAAARQSGQADPTSGTAASAVSRKPRQQPTAQASASMTDEEKQEALRLEREGK